MRTKWFQAIKRFIELFTVEGTEYTEDGTAIVYTRNGVYIPRSEYGKILSKASKELNAVAPLSHPNARDERGQ